MTKTYLIETASCYAGTSEKVRLRGLVFPWSFRGGEGCNYPAPRTDDPYDLYDMYDLYDLFPLDHLDLTEQLDPWPAWSVYQV